MPAALAQALSRDILVLPKDRLTFWAVSFWGRNWRNKILYKSSTKMLAFKAVSWHVDMVASWTHLGADSEAVAALGLSGFDWKVSSWLWYTVIVGISISVIFLYDNLELNDEIHENAMLAFFTSYVILRPNYPEAKPPSKAPPILSTFAAPLLEDLSFPEHVSIQTSDKCSGMAETCWALLGDGNSRNIITNNGTWQKKHIADSQPQVSTSQWLQLKLLPRACPPSFPPSSLLSSQQGPQHQRRWHEIKQHPQEITHVSCSDRQSNWPPSSLRVSFLPVSSPPSSPPSFQPSPSQKWHFHLTFW